MEILELKIHSSLDLAEARVNLKTEHIWLPFFPCHVTFVLVGNILTLSIPREAWVTLFSCLSCFYPRGEALVFYALRFLKPLWDFGGTETHYLGNPCVNILALVFSCASPSPLHSLWKLLEGEVVQFCSSSSLIWSPLGWPFQVLSQELMAMLCYIVLPLRQ